MEIHLIENNELSQMHRDTHAKKFQYDLNFTFNLLCQGKRLTDKILVQKFEISGRRLRELYAEREQIKRKSGWAIDKEWIKGGDGKTKCVEYFAIAPHLPLKSEVIERSAKVIEMMKKIPDKELVTIFELEDNPPTFKQGQINFND